MFDEKTTERFWSKVAVGAMNECWEWQAGKYANGYGQYYAWPHNVPAHRAAWMIANDQEIPQGLFVRHKCDNPLCCNPAHLEVGTPADNVRDMVERGRNRKGSGCQQAKLSEEDVVDIRRLLSAGHGAVELGKQFGVTHSTISLIASGRIWAWLEDEG